MSDNREGAIDFRYIIRNGEKVLQQRKKRILKRTTFYTKIEIWWEDRETYIEKGLSNVAED